ncbi:alpha/beta hydrolase [Ureibacillus thermophilus]|uniref:Alpha/beta hydrolase fold-3 domain-containing protein n=1 Tax=Ureibacillus thermophilus TaxID=367743 RepID=A0A4P6UUH8_9BACL|nr:alpha/beta hydrolase fold domain-containing protein [Ureibacillus thermophilus]QBK26215.1 hypothetical protein DKZ56_10275 [Ureibacillus thermophilus]
MPIHLYIEQYFQAHPEARKRGIEIKNPPIEKRPKVWKVEEKLVSAGTLQIPIRIYIPNEEEKHPLFIFFHGGTFIPGGVESHDVSCRMICSLTGYKVIAIDYTTESESQSFQQCDGAVKWIMKHAESLGVLSDEIAIGGSSIGAHFAINIVLNFICQGIVPFKKQVLYYPIIEWDDQVKTSPHISRMLFNGKYGLDLTMHSIYLSPSISYYAPLYENNNDLAQMPPTLIFTAEYDPLCDEGDQFAEELRKIGVDVKYVRFDGNVHGFMQNFPGSPDYMRGHDITAAFLAFE